MIDHEFHKHSLEKMLGEFTDKPVSRKLLQELVDIAHAALPSDGDWRFLIIENPVERSERLLRMHDETFSKGSDDEDDLPEIYLEMMKFYQNLSEPADMMYAKAPGIIFLIGPKDKKDVFSNAYDMMIANNTGSNGLSIMFFDIGEMISRRPEIKELLSLSPDDCIYGPMLIGYKEHREIPFEQKKRFFKKGEKSNPEMIWV